MEARLYRRTSPEADSLRSHLWPILTQMTSKSDRASRLKAVQDLNRTAIKTVARHDRQQSFSCTIKDKAFVDPFLMMFSDNCVKF